MNMRRKKETMQHKKWVAVFRIGLGNYRHFQLLPERIYSEARQREKEMRCEGWEKSKKQKDRKKKERKKRLIFSRTLDCRFF